MRKVVTILAILVLIVFAVVFINKEDREMVLPNEVKNLCEGNSTTKFIADDGFKTTFHGEAKTVQKCDGNMWKAVEAATVTEGGTFYFNKTGEFIDMCQLLFRRDVCERYKNLSCGDKNYCS